MRKLWYLVILVNKYACSIILLVFFRYGSYYLFCDLWIIVYVSLWFEVFDGLLLYL